MGCGGARRMMGIGAAHANRADVSGDSRAARGVDRQIAGRRERDETGLNGRNIGRGAPAATKE